MSEFCTPAITPESSDHEGMYTWPPSAPIVFGRQDTFRRETSRTGARSRNSSQHTRRIHSIPESSTNDVALVSLTLNQKGGGVTLTWSDLNCYAPIYKKGWLGQNSATGDYKQLLYNMKGVVQPGTLAALMGASGAGKTTLLNVLTCRSRNLGDLRVDGSVRVNGVSMGAKIKNVSGYVEQLEMFFGCLTVREHLIYSAMLKMGDKNYSAEDRENRVNAVMSQFGLDRCANSFVNNAKSDGISGSEKKMLSIASEILVDQSLLFCDEPTTGLDATMARTVVRILKQMSQRGKTIICTIHQPSSHIFEMFDRIILLGEGQQVFQGTPEETDSFFSKTLALPCPPVYNPADHYIHALAIRPGSESTGKKFVTATVKQFESTPEHTIIVQQISTIESKQTTNGNQAKEIFFEVSRASSYKASWWGQVKTITWKQSLDMFRNQRLFFFRILQCFIQASIIATLYFQQDYNQFGVVNINGASYTLVLQMTNMALIQMSSFCSEMRMFYREHQSGMYRADTFFFAKNISEIPVFILMVTVTATVCYWSIGMYPGVYQFLIYLLIFSLVYHSSLSVMVYTVGMLAERPDLALTVATPLRMSMSLLSGYWVNDASVPWVLTWWRYISWHWYSYRIILTNQWSNVKTIDCVKVPGQNSDSTASCYSTGQDVLNFLNFQDTDMTYLVFLILLVIGFRILPFLILLIKSRDRKFKSK